MSAASLADMANGTFQEYDFWPKMQELLSDIA